MTTVLSPRGTDTLTWPAGLRDDGGLSPASLALVQNVVQPSTDLVRNALTIADSAFSHVSGVRMKDRSSGDLVTDTDLRIEMDLIEKLRRRWPEHRCIGEETAASGSVSSPTWIIDPLDGTNNFAVGLPTYGVSLALALNDSVVLSIIGQGMTGRVAVSHVGAVPTVDGVACRPFVPEERPRAALWLGYGMASGPDLPQVTRHLLAESCDRVFESWSPISDTFSMLQGGIQLVVALNCSGTEIPSALLFMRQLGWSVALLDRSAVSWVDPAPGRRTVSFVAWREDHGRARAVAEDLKTMLSGLLPIQVA